MTDHPNIAAALAAFQAEVPSVPKNKTANVPTKSGGSYKYDYADLADVMKAAAPVMAKHGLSFTASPRMIEDGSYVIDGTLLHTSGESRAGTLPLYGRSMQEIGSSLTYARRYLLGCLSGVVTDADTDAAEAQDAPRTTGRRNRPKPRRDDTTAATGNGDKAAAVFAAMEAATTVDELRDIYREHGVGSAPQHIKDAFTARRDAIAASSAPDDANGPQNVASDPPDGDAG